MICHKSVCENVMLHSTPQRTILIVGLAQGSNFMWPFLNQLKASAALQNNKRLQLYT